MHEPAFWYQPRSPLSYLLRPLGGLYGAIAARRMAREGLEPCIPVICVGNYHAGGAGKTPTVLALTSLLRELGESPAVVSRGYRGRLRGPVMVDRQHHNASDVGDEPLMMVNELPVAVARNRLGGVALAKSQGATAILLDDGFQDPRIMKDAALIVIDSERGLGNGQVFPAGPLRGPLKPQIARTDALVLIGDGHAADYVAAEIAMRDKPVLRARLKPDSATVAKLVGKRVLAFAGIGDPERFFRILRSNGIEVACTHRFTDHHMFSKADIEALSARAKREQLTLVTTEKDLARLLGSNLYDQAMPFAVEIEFDDPAGLRAAISTYLYRARERCRLAERLQASVHALAGFTV
ncbi:tetraacyldisaccharide 4'-kinase [Bradyrhizobium sp. CCBAU 53340]|uniref:tetraacyldisaccharide 4'-kinase n=1 Tax=Bradyrhizobium sp. CCBAU 53340 TaxID=1325112 RepID=UPI00188CBCBD|nr:tetraacyldisaccharide 4'-kinase [Bradyrhizobium sp. CCBAU 53340]QOZ44722.1 tetraacyldisaccharide 4'-kinase [Bradyrhizobium sp. CCBAU 53340]